MMNVTAEDNTRVPVWHRQADVIVVGYGAAGAATAIAAHEAGAKVVILEKMEEGGGNTLLSMGGFLCPSNVERAVKYISSLYEFSNSEKDEKVIHAFAEEAAKNCTWLKSLREGVTMHVYGHASFSELPGAKSMDKYLIHGRAKGATAFAQNLWTLLTNAVEQERGIPVLKNTPARRLVTNREGEVIGVLADTGRRKIAIKAGSGVVLCTGGYEFDRELLRNHLKGFPIYAAGNPGNTGDGVRMAQKVGAGLWHMNAVSCGLGIKVTEFEAGFIIVIDSPGYIIVDKQGLRFMNERGMEAHAGLLAVDYYDAQILQYPRIPCYAIFDEVTRKRGPITRLAGHGFAGRNYKWSKDNTIEIQKGWIVKGDTLTNLAESLKLDPKTLEDTVGRWNADVRNGLDSQFRRPIISEASNRPAYNDFEASLLSAPIDQPPYYGLELYPCLANTQGGPRRNEAAQVLDPFGQPIPRLYSAGELGSMWGFIYQGAGNIAECLVFGRIAGKNAALETPWG